MDKKIFIICPVRNVKQEVNEKITAYVTTLETRGHEVYWPYRDNPYQEADKIGRTIIGLNREKMIEADEVHVWYDKNSTGSIFDIGMFFALVHAHFRKFVIINRADVVSTPHKSFENVLWELEKEFDSPVANGLAEWRKR